MVRTPGVEPGLAGWEPAVITTRPCPLGFSVELFIVELSESITRMKSRG